MKKILHLTEALGGGIVSSISQLTNAQLKDGFEIVFVHSIRPDTPAQDTLDRLFPAPIIRLVLPMVTSVSVWRDLSSAFHLIKLFKKIRPDVIHLHSSKAGVLGRIAARLLGWQDKVFYSPHGFSFLRQDVSPLKRKIFLGFERFCTVLGGTLVGCSASEVQLAREKVAHPRVMLIENSVDMAHIGLASGSLGGSVRVVTSGLINYAKAPWRFRDMAVHLSDEPANFLWMGDGQLRHELFVDGNLPPNLAIMGWRDRKDILEELCESEIFVLFSLWEGMPLALIEAQATGLPAVVLDVVGCRDVVQNGITGFVCASMEEVTNKLRLLIRDPVLRAELGANARLMAQQRFFVERMHNEMLLAYGISATIS